MVGPVVVEHISIGRVGQAIPQQLVPPTLHGEKVGLRSGWRDVVALENLRVYDKG